MHKHAKKVRTHDEQDIYYEMYKGERNHAPVFFVHGVGGDVDAWHFVRSKLHTEGYTTMAKDLRGHGFTSHPRAFKAYSMDAYVSDFIAVLDAEKIHKVILIGHSYGAFVATYMALMHPERVEKLVLISSSYGPPSYLKLPGTKQLAKFLINILAFVSLPPIKPGHSIYPEGKHHKDFEWFGLAKTLARNSWRSYLLATKLVFDLDLKEKLQELKMPTLVMTGNKDSIYSIDVSEFIHKQIPNSTFEIIDGGNHVVVLNNVDQVANAILRFL